MCAVCGPEQSRGGGIRQGLRGALAWVSGSTSAFGVNHHHRVVVQRANVEDERGTGDIGSEGACPSSASERATLSINMAALRAAHAEASALIGWSGVAKGVG